MPDCPTEHLAYFMLRPTPFVYPVCLSAGVIHVPYDAIVVRYCAVIPMCSAGIEPSVRNEAIRESTATDRLWADYAAKVGLRGGRSAPHALRATAATNALEHEADIAPGAGVARARQHRYDANLRPT